MVGTQGISAREEKEKMVDEMSLRIGRRGSLWWGKKMRI
jgi:hypothetical protein